jgi:hypothetical protein
LGKFAVVDLESRGIDARGSSCFSHESIVPAAYQSIKTRNQREQGSVKVSSRAPCAAHFAATPLPTRKCGENSGKLVCESVAVTAKIRYPDVSFFKDQTKTAVPRGYRERSQTECSANGFGNRKHRKVTDIFYLTARGSFQRPKAQLFIEPRITNAPEMTRTSDLRFRKTDQIRVGARLSATHC